MADPIRAADVVVVGGGSSGCVVAARLSENPGRSVLLLESGPGYRSVSDCPVLDYRTLPVGPGSAFAETYGVELAPSVPSAMVRGHVLGGSGAVNGAYFVRGTEADFRHWPASWSYENVLPAFRALERDADFDDSRHGTTGLMPVRRQPAERLSEISAAFRAAALGAGHPEEPDKNGAGVGGIGPVPLNVDGGRRVSTAVAYLLPAWERPNLTVEANSDVVRILFSGNETVGVEVESDGVRHTVRTGRVVLAAGPVETPVLLMLSGIGPAEHLTNNDIPVVLDAPGVGSDFSDHPEVALPYRIRDTLRRSDTSPVVETVLNVGDLEIRPYTAPFDVLVPGSGQPDPVLGIGLMVTDSRGDIRLTSRHRRDRPRIEYRYAQSAADRRALREGQAIGLELLRSPELGPLVVPLSEEVSDRAVLAHLGTSLHLCGSCRMGGRDDEGAVVDEWCNVRGMEGLTIADTSVFPVVPSRGPHATAVMVAERVSTFLGE
ncbi:choline dehydrogenase [Rhodococcus opacus PD630]|uniref:mycofactocin dehydrogenase MftG n=1 Tax=Rhodococcus TaxID=1827 RepID=UPI00029CBE78|nr:MULTISPECIES: mycofactocin system GMC family oxidoreductase MftG [Rhodococcus]RZK85024.1 MAG: mycofactocin system GMC family oxidoreductase MftG [Rhodococcus sp. (in: high G+C Gram-positive bacteria)]AHK29943.1 putative GMC-type oxidoreductase in thcA 5'region [Rhodococcus opacus PD630]EHI46265.1 choline dehydrogenase [Rhodococcus opacus PD630]KXX56164.1 choline dehydrogenase [Rhodococcus sp. LB1]UDG99643.1 mycofactocin system GMC family oxidoreductase MftG [Rhodococcus opacus PD630]